MEFDEFHGCFGLDVYEIEKNGEMVEVGFMSTVEEIEKAIGGLPRVVRALARKNYRLWLRDSWHPSLHFKPIGNYWSVRVGLSYRALGREKDGTLYWFWIGHHKEYDRLVSQM